MSKDIEWSSFTILVILICFLQKSQSLNQTISDEKCDDTEETFICAIPRNRTDGFKTFASRCALATYNCQHKHGLQYIYRSDGPCPNSDPQKQCPRPCVPPHHPVCGSLKGFGPHISFPSLCELENYNCEHEDAQYKIVFNGRCEDINCIKACPADDSPICGAPVIGFGEPQTFKNFCEMRNYNCNHRDKEYGIVNLGACLDHPIAPPPLPPSASMQCGDCDPVHRPVCGRIPNTGEERTFENRCELEQFNCLHDGDDYKYIRDGTCGQICSGNCSREYEPICARSLLGDKPPQTFNSLCLLDYYNCQEKISGSDDIFEYFYDGQCQIEPSLPTPTAPPPPQCPLQCNVSYAPICAESRETPELKRTFSSVCELYNHNCLFKHDVYYMIQNKTCVENNSCVQTCPDTPQILCASPQNQLGPNVEFRNRCYLNNYNCIHFYSKYDFLHDGSCVPTATQPAPTRRPTPSTTPLPCKRTCSADYAPVCAESKRSKTKMTFHNHCEMSNYNCDFSGDDSFEFSHGGKCEAEVIPRPPILPEQTCLKVCTDQYSPVCASYGWGLGMKTTFRNRCLLDNYNCDHRLFNYEILYEGECRSEVFPEPPSQSIVDCSTLQCTGEYKPVCAVQYFDLADTRTFINRCVMTRHNCEHVEDAYHLYKIISEGECPSKPITTTTTTTARPPPQCPIPCEEEDKNPVCATSRENPNIRRTFSSDCNLYNHNCLTMHDIYDFTAWDPCPEFVPPKNNSCFSTCPDTEQTLCAFPENRLGPNVEFRNRCYLNNYNCIHNSYTRYNFLHDGPCQPTQTEPPTETPTKPPCKVSCTEGYNPICAVSKLYHSKATFKNICEMDNYNCDYGSYGFEYAHPGKCQAEVIETPPVKPTCLRVCTQEYLPVCAAQIWGLGMKRTFENRCVLDNYNCENFLFKFEIINEGECKPEAVPESPSLPLLDCRNIQCTRENHPVCTTSQRQPGLTKAFSNRCMMNMYNCEHANDQYDFLHYGLCKSTAPETSPGFSCIKDCECTRRPICAAPRHGTGPRKTFTNRCKLENYNCENLLNPYDYDYDGECRPALTPLPLPTLPSPSLNCIKDCECDYKPVCASAIHKQSPQRTFQNRCKLENHNCEFYTDQYQFEFEGECPKFEKLIMREIKSSQNQYDCIKACPQTYDPVCTAPNEGTNFMSFKRTFHNMCELENHNCIFTISRYSVLHTGECSSEIKPTYQ